MKFEADSQRSWRWHIFFLSILWSWSPLVCTSCEFHCFFCMTCAWFFFTRLRRISFQFTLMLPVFNLFLLFFVSLVSSWFYWILIDFGFRPTVLVWVLDDGFGCSFTSNTGGGRISWVTSFTKTSQHENMFCFLRPFWSISFVLIL